MASRNADGIGDAASEDSEVCAAETIVLYLLESGSSLDNNYVRS